MLKIRTAKFIAHFWILLLCICQACSPLGEPVNEKISDNYYYNGAGDGVIYSRMGNWFELGADAMEVDLKSFEVLGSHFAKDKKNAYYQGQPIKMPDFDLKSFRISRTDYMWHTGFDKNHVYVFDPYEETRIVKDADPKTFVRTDLYWAKDANRHFYNDRPITVEYNSFEVINKYFCKDSLRAYHYGEGKVVGFEADIPTLDKLDDIYIYDEHNIYYYAWYVRRELVDSLVTIPYQASEIVKTLNDDYLQVGDKIYCNGGEVAGADANSFKLLDNLYAKDQYSVYYWGLKIPEADVATFQYSKKNYAYKDKNHLYKEGKVAVDP